MPTLDEDAWRATEPHTPSPAARLDAVAELRRRGIDSGVLIAPLMPGINDTPTRSARSSSAPAKAGATFLGGVALHLRDEVKDVFFAWLEEKRPDLLPRYEQLYKGRAYMRPAQRKHDHASRPRLGPQPPAQRLADRVRAPAGGKSAPRAGGAGGRPAREEASHRRARAVPAATGPARQEPLSF